MKTLFVFLGLVGISCGIPGNTTRYWDCCKPSCAWNGKAPVNRPVLSCAKDGVTAVGVNELSGCNGGPAFTCNNNQPWAVNDTLAYGFAAVSLSCQEEWNWCCVCYELTFTSGPAQGKKMIVQITNTGSDLKQNNFDLQMPGGGVGMFNGCQPQWGAPAQGWGARYGGVSSESQCQQLPPQLQPGCRWRFQWLLGADNPSVDYKPISCPSELTQRSLCTVQQNCIKPSSS